MNDNNLEEKTEKEKKQEAGQKTAHVIGKGLSSYASGGAGGGRIYEAASKLPQVKKAEEKLGKQLQRNPVLNKASQKLNESGALDAANKGIDAVEGANSGSSPNSSGSAPASSGSSPSSSMNLGDKSNSSSNGRFASGLEKNLLDKYSGSSSTSATAETEEGYFDDSAVNKMGELFKKHWQKILPVIASFLLFIILIAGVMGVILGPADTVIQFFRDAWDNLKTLVGYKSEEEWELEYYKKLDEVQEELNKKYGVCIDINLITATLTVNVTSENMIEEGQVPEDSTGAEIPTFDYKKMIKQVELLGNMQIRRTIYGLDDRYKKDTGEYCKDEAEQVLFDDDSRKLDFNMAKGSGFFTTTRNMLIQFGQGIKGTPVRDSSSVRKIASNDIDPGIWKFLTKKANEEKNIEYMFYYPAFTIEDVKDANGKVIDKRKVCYDQFHSDPYDFARLDIGSLNDMTNNVYYWNLMDSFIADYYEDYLPSTSGPLEVGSEKYEKVKNIIEDIYLLYNEMGPNQSCEAQSYICRDDEGSDYYGGGEISLDRSEFIEIIAPTAIEEMTRTGVFASITLAQATIESANGSSGLSKKYSNYYGMTAGSCAPISNPSGFSGRVYASGEGGNSCTGNAFWNGSVVAMCNSSGADCQWYRVYDSFTNSTRDHSRLLSDKYGCNTKPTYEEQLDCIIAHGYATDPNYKKTIMGMIQKYNLAQYDIGTWNGNIEPITDQQYTNSICGGGTASGDWANWKQYDPAWKDVPLGPSTVGSIGCAMTSVAIQIMRSGVSTTLGANFNPGTFAQELAKNGGFDSAGNITWSAASKIAPSFQFAGMGSYTDVSQIDGFVKSGYYVILQVKSGKHWVAVDRVEGNKIYMFDPGSGGTEVGQTYGMSSIRRYVLYKKG